MQFRAPVERYTRWCHQAGLILPLAFGLGGCATATRRVLSASDSVTAVIRLDRVVDEYTRFLQRSRPELAARASSFITTLPSPTQDGVKRNAQYARSALSSLDEVRVDALTQDDYVTWLALRWEMEAIAGWAAFHWTALSDLAPGNSVFDRSVEILRSQNITEASSAQRISDVVSGVATLALGLRSEYAARAERGIRLPRAVASRAIEHVRGFIAPPDASPFTVPLDSLPALDSASRLQGRERLQQIISNRVNPALDSLASLLERERERANDSLGLLRLPGGDVHYAALLRYHSTIDITPEQAHVVGLREVARLAPSAAAARDAAGLPVHRDSLRARLTRDSTFLFDERSSIPERAAQLLASIGKDVDSLFGSIPLMALTIGELPAAEGAPLAKYEWPTLNRASARYLINIEELESRSALVLPGLVAGDLMPGLHLQQGTQLANTELPPFRRLAMNQGFTRGWQLYAIGVADSLGNNLAPWQRFGLRMRELAAACALVVDTGINALGWSRNDALTFLRAYLPDDDEDLEREFVFPAAETPAVLAAGTLGARELRGLRRWAMRESGDRFRLPAFHAEVLRVGSVPLPVLGAHLERWIWEMNQAAPPPAGPPR